jgi:hypothetical protein
LAPPAGTLMCTFPMFSKYFAFIWHFTITI